MGLLDSIKNSLKKQAESETTNDSTSFIKRSNKIRPNIELTFLRELVLEPFTTQFR